MDHGNTEVTDISHLRILPENFKVIPVFCSRGKLGGVLPSGGQWSDVAVEDFKTAVMDKSVVIVVFTLVFLAYFIW